MLLGGARNVSLVVTHPTRHERIPKGSFAEVQIEGGNAVIPSTLLISPAPKPVKVRLCLGLEKPGPTGP